MKTPRFLQALCAGLAAVVLASPGAAAGLSLRMTNTVTVTTTSAVVRVYVSSNDAAGAYVWLYWGLTNNGNNATWPNTNAVGAVTNGAVQSVSLAGLTPGTTYWATAYATNGTTNAWATWQTNFTTIASIASTGTAVTAYPDGRIRDPTNFFEANTGTVTAARITSLESGVLGLTNAMDSATNRLAVVESGTSTWYSAWINSTQWLASVAYGITSGMTSQWDQAYTAGTSWLVSVAHGITSAMTNDWTTSFTWGNHALAGYLLPASTQALATVAHSGVYGDLTGKPDVVTNNQTSVTFGAVDVSSVTSGGTNAALWFVTATNAWMDIGTNRIYLTP